MAWDPKNAIPTPTSLPESDPGQKNEALPSPTMQDDHIILQRALKASMQIGSTQSPWNDALAIYIFSKKGH